MRKIIITAFVIFTNHVYCQNNENKDSLTLQEVTVTASSPVSKGSTFVYDASEAVRTISVLGEPDVLRHISSFPGVSAGIDGTLGLFVRGGNNGSNGLYLDDVPLYVSSHLMGLVSVYPPEVVDNVTFSQGGMSSSKGNLSSALLDVKARRQFGSAYSGSVYLSPYICGVYQNLPIKKGRTSLQISGRVTVLPYILNWFNKSDDDVNIDIYDFCARLDSKLSERCTLDLMFFHTNDNFDFTNDDERNLGQRWKSTIMKVGWRFYINEKFNLKTIAYRNDVYSGQKSIYFNDYSKAKDSHIQLYTSLTEWCVSLTLNWNVCKELSFAGGLSSQVQKFTLGNYEYIRDVDRDRLNEQKDKSTLNVIYADLKYNIGQLADVGIGARQVFQKINHRHRSGTDLHAISHWYITENYGVELTYDNMKQYYHVLEGLPSGWSMNLMKASDNDYPEEKTSQFYAGLFAGKKTSAYELKATIGGYYRTMNGIISYKDARNAFGFLTTELKDEVCQGKGKSYGMESSVSLMSKNIQATLSYTLSKTDRTYPEMNRGESFPFKFDRRHILNFEGTCVVARTNGEEKSYEHSIGCAVSYSSGNRITIPIGTYKGVAPPYWERSKDGLIHSDEFFFQIYDRQYMSDVNAIKMKDYFRTDISYSMKRRGKIFTNELSLSVYNVFNRHNPYTIFHDEGKWKQLSIVPIMPSIRWGLSW